MNVRSLAILLLAAPLAASQREDMAFEFFDAVPSAPHPMLAAELAWLDRGRASFFASTRPEGEGVASAPHFQMLYGAARHERERTSPRDSVVERVDRSRLRLATGISLSQLGPFQGGAEGFDVAVGVAFERERIVSRWSPFDGTRQWTDLSLAARMERWTLGAVLAEAATLSTDSGTEGHRRVGLMLQRTGADGLDWGGAVDIPLQTGGEAGVRLGVARDFRDALSFHSQIATSYAEERNIETGRRELVRRSLELRLGTRLRFRPWGAMEGVSWMRPLVDPQLFATNGGGSLLRGWELGVSASWDLVGGRAAPAIEVAKAF